MKPAFAVAAGVYSFKYFEANHIFVGLLFFILLLCFLSFYTKKWISNSLSLLWFVAFAGVGFYSHYLDYNSVKHGAVTGEKKFLAVINSEQKEKKRSFEYDLKVLQLEKDSSLSGKSFLVRAYFQKTDAHSLLEFGDTVVVKTKINPVENFNESFDYKKYLSHKYIYQTCYIPSSSCYIYKSNKWHLKKQMYLTKMYCLALVDSLAVSVNSKALIKAIVLGNKNDLLQETKESFADAGAMHVLAVSGLHVGVVYLLLDKMLFFMVFGHLRRLKWLLVLGGVWCFALISGASDSVFRAALMFSCLALAKISGRGYSVYNALAIAAIVSLVVDPRSLFNVGFWLSYSAVAGIVYLYPLLYNFLKTGRKVLDYFIQLSVVSVSAQLVTLPIVSMVFGEIPLYGIVSNIVVIHLALVVLVGGIALMVMNASGWGFVWAEELFTLLLDWGGVAVSYIAELPFAVVAFKMEPIGLLLYYSVFVAICVYFEKRRQKHAYELA